MSIKRALMMSALLVALGVSNGCATERYVYVQPQCTVPPMPALPSVDRAGVWDQMGDTDYRIIEAYIDGLWSVVDEQRAILREVCDGQDE